MQVGDSTPVTSALGATQAPPVHPAVRQSGNGRATEHDRRGGGERDGGASFRANLDAALPNDLDTRPATQQMQRVKTAAEAPRPERRPAADAIEIEAAESAQLFADTLNTARAGKSQDSAAEMMPTTAQQRHRTVAHQYAQNFFSVGGTFAARGDQLEVSA